jgi:homogentisate 1,2-dioxygenase
LWFAHSVRPYDFDPNAVPAPYNHSNVDSDEVLYYASSEFMSRKGIEFGSITHHPDGILTDRIRVVQRPTAPRRRTSSR